MARSKVNIITALDISKQLFTWDFKLRKEAFQRHLKQNLDQAKVTGADRVEVMNIIENIMYVVTDKKRYVAVEENVENPEAFKEASDRIYDIKTTKNGYFYREDWKVVRGDRPPHNKEIADELLQLKIRLHEEIMVVKNDIKLCKQFIKSSFEEPTIKSLAIPKLPRRNSDTAALTKHLGYSPTAPIKGNNTLPRSNSSSSLNQSKKKVTVRRRGSTTSLLDELQSTKEQPKVSILLGDGVFDQISQKRLVGDNRDVETFCKAHYFLENGFERLTEYVINNPGKEVASVCILLGGNNLDQRTAAPVELAMTMMSAIKDLLKRISGHVFVYALLPRLDNATLDRNVSHFNSQLASALFQARLSRVSFVQNIIPREAKCFQSDGKSLAGAGLNKLMRTVRKNMSGER